MELVEDFKRRYYVEEEEKVRQQKADEEVRMFSRELPGRYTTKLLYRWGNKKYDQEY